MEFSRFVTGIILIICAIILFIISIFLLPLVIFAVLVLIIGVLILINAGKEEKIEQIKNTKRLNTKKSKNRKEGE